MAKEEHTAWTRIGEALAASAMVGSLKAAPGGEGMFPLDATTVVAILALERAAEDIKLLGAEEGALATEHLQTAVAATTAATARQLANASAWAEAVASHLAAQADSFGTLEQRLRTAKAAVSVGLPESQAWRGSKGAHIDTTSLPEELEHIRENWEWHTSPGQHVAELGTAAAIVNRLKALARPLVFHPQAHFQEARVDPLVGTQWHVVVRLRCFNCGWDSGQNPLLFLTPM